MRRLAIMVVAVLACHAFADGAAAQRRSSAAPRAGTANSDDNLPPSVPPPVSTLSPTRGIAGPRLQPGAVLCRDEADLQHRAEVNRRQADGQSDAGNPMENCKLVNQERGVEIVARRGLGRTEVKVKPTGETGWTDAYLP